MPYNLQKRKEYNRLYYQKNKEKFREREKIWKKRNKEKVMIWQQRWREKNREKTRESSKRWREKNPEKAKERMRRDVLSGKAKIRGKKYRQRHPERCKEHSRKFRQSEKYLQWYKNYREHNREKLKKYRHEHYLKNKAKALHHWRTRKARKLQVGGSFTIEEFEELKAKTGYKCLRCNKKEPEICLTADHIKPLCRGGANDITNIQPLCMDCNLRKGQKEINFKEES